MFGSGPLPGLHGAKQRPYSGLVTFAAMAAEQWEVAEAAATAAGVELEPLESAEDADQILEVMTSTWGITAGLPTR